MEKYNLDDISIFMKGLYKYEKDKIENDDNNNAYNITIHSL